MNRTDPTPAKAGRISKRRAKPKPSSRGLASRRKRSMRPAGNPPPVDVETVRRKAPVEETVPEQARKGFDLLVIGVEPAREDGRLLGSRSRASHLGFDGPFAVVVARGTASRGSGSRRARHPRAGHRHRFFAARRGSRVGSGARGQRHGHSAVTSRTVPRHRRSAMPSDRTRANEDAILREIAGWANSRV